MFRLLTEHCDTYAVELLSKLKFSTIIAMRKSRQHVATLKEHRVKNREKNSNTQNYGASNCYLQIIGTGARGAPRCVYLFTDNSKYIFRLIRDSVS